MPEFIIPGEDDASVFPEYFEHGKLKAEYVECISCGKLTGGMEMCDACLDRLFNDS